MENKKNYIFEIKLGLAISAASFLWILLEYFSGFHSTYIEYHATITLFGLLIPIVGMIILYRKLKIKYRGFTFVEGVRSGMVPSFVVAALAIIIQLIYHLIINPSFFDFMIQYSKSKGFMMSDKYFNLPSYLIQSFAGSLFICGLTAIILSALKRRR